MAHHPRYRRRRESDAVYLFTPGMTRKERKQAYRVKQKLQNLDKGAQIHLANVMAGLEFEMVGGHYETRYFPEDDPIAEMRGASYQQFVADQHYPPVPMFQGAPRGPKLERIVPPTRTIEHAKRTKRLYLGLLNEIAQSIRGEIVVQIPAPSPSAIEHCRNLADKKAVDRIAKHGMI